MHWPEGALDETPGLPQLAIGPTGRVEPTLAADAADDRFASICAELGILLARHVEPVSARVLPFGREQLAMVQLLDGTEGRPTIVTAAAHGHSRGVAVAEAAIDAMTGGDNVLTAALPTAVAEGKVRTAVVFAEGDAPVRWGRADDEGRLAALYAVVPQLGTFTATAGPDTYRVLRLPGVGVSLVSEGPSAAAWVEGWFAALIHATQLALRTDQPTTSVVAHEQVPAPRAEPADETATVLSQLEAECRRILTSAQEQAAEILEAARRESALAAEQRRHERAQLDALRTEAEASRRVEHGRDEQRQAAERERDELLADAHQARKALLDETKAETDARRREAERACAALLAGAQRDVDEMLRDAEHARSRMLEEARSELEEVRHEAARSRRRLEDGPRRGKGRDGRFAPDPVGEARRAADDVLYEARRAADEIIRDAARTRQRLLDEPTVPTAWTRPLPYGAPGDQRGPGLAPAARPPEPATRAAELALLTAAAESVAAMAALLGRVAGAGGATASAEPLDDVPGLFFGA